MPEAGFAPIDIVALDLGEPLTTLQARCSPSGVPYRTLRALVRIHEDPVALLDLPFPGERISAESLASLIWAQSSEAILAHGKLHGCLPVDGLDASSLSRGLPSDTCPRLSGESWPFVNVVVTTARSPERLRPCIASLLALRYPNFQIDIVDNAPGEDGIRAVVESIAREDPRVRYHAEPVPGLSIARNRAIRETTGEIIAFTDDDVHVDPGWLQWLIVPFLADARVGVATGLVLPARLDTREQLWFEQFAGFGKGIERRVYDLDANAANDHLLYPYWGAVFGSGNSMAYRRRVLLEMGGFDPALGAGSKAWGAGEDVDAMSRAVVRGERLAYEPRAVCWHDHRADQAALRKQTFNYTVGATANLTKWLLHDPRIAWQLVSELAGLLRRSPRAGQKTSGSSSEASQVAVQLRMRKEEGDLLRYLGAFAIGPFVYLRSALWVRRTGPSNGPVPGRRSAATVGVEESLAARSFARLLATYLR